MLRLRWHLVNVKAFGTDSNSGGGDDSGSDGEDSSRKGGRRPAARSGDQLSCVIDANGFERPVFLQADPTAEGHFY